MAIFGLRDRWVCGSKSVRSRLLALVLEDILQAERSCVRRAYCDSRGERRATGDRRRQVSGISIFVATDGRRFCLLLAHFERRKPESPSVGCYDKWIRSLRTCSGQLLRPQWNLKPEPPAVGGYDVGSIGSSKSDWASGGRAFFLARCSAKKARRRLRHSSARTPGVMRHL